MDYTKDLDITQQHRKFKPSGSKMVLKCKKCPGRIICYIEDTVYLCAIHKISPTIEDFNPNQSVNLNN